MRPRAAASGPNANGRVCTFRARPQGSPSSSSMLALPHHNQAPKDLPVGQAAGDGGPTVTARGAGPCHCWWQSLWTAAGAAAGVRGAGV
jgi:hypothetical protein